MWDLDLQDFYDALFESIPRVTYDPLAEKNISLLVKTLIVTLYDTRQLSTDRVAGMYVRVCVCLCVCVVWLRRIYLCWF